MDLLRTKNRYYCFVCQVGGKGIRTFKTLKFLTEHLKTKESTHQISTQVAKYGYPAHAYSNKAKAHILIHKCLIETPGLVKRIEYLPLDEDIESDFIRDGLDLTKKNIEK